MLCKCVGEGPGSGALALGAAAAVWIGGGGPQGPGERRAWVTWYGKKLSPPIEALEASAGHRWVILQDPSTKRRGRSDGGGEGEEEGRLGFRGDQRGQMLSSREWKGMGRSPLEAAWGAPPSHARITATPGLLSEARSGAEQGWGPAAPLPTIALPRFAAWLRAVVRREGGEAVGDKAVAGGGAGVGASGCQVTGALLSVALVGGHGPPASQLWAYIRRMAREVYLPCEFGGVMEDMARQWLQVLIEAELSLAAMEGGSVAGAGEGPVCQGRARERELGRGLGTLAPPSFLGASAGGSGSGAAPADGSVHALANRASTLELVLREELLLCMGGVGSWAMPAADPSSWLWPLEALANTPLKVEPLQEHSSSGKASEPGRVRSRSGGTVAEAPGQALGRALQAVPDDLLCGARLFERSRGPELALPSLSKFVSQVVELVEAGLTAHPPRWELGVCLRLVVGLGLLYHVLSAPNLPIGPPKGTLRYPVASEEAVAGEVEKRGKGEFLVEEAFLDIDKEKGTDNAKGAGVEALLNAILELMRSLLSVIGNAGMRGNVSGLDASPPHPDHKGWCDEDLGNLLCGSGAWRAYTALVSTPGVSHQKEKEEETLHGTQLAQLPELPGSLLVESGRQPAVSKGNFFGAWGSRSVEDMPGRECSGLAQTSPLAGVGAGALHLRRAKEAAKATCAMVRAMDEAPSRDPNTVTATAGAGAVAAQVTGAAPYPSATEQVQQAAARVWQGEGSKGSGGNGWEEGGGPKRDWPSLSPAGKESRDTQATLNQDLCPPQKRDLETTSRLGLRVIRQRVAHASERGVSSGR
ncbi:unnamed protein product [Discosporangium mesarthrocarpum]